MTMIGDPPNIMIGSGLSPDAIERAEGGKYAELAADGVNFNDFHYRNGSRNNDDCSSSIHAAKVDVS